MTGPWPSEVYLGELPKLREDLVKDAERRMRLCLESLEKDGHHGHRRGADRWAIARHHRAGGGHQRRSPRDGDAREDGHHASPHRQRRRARDSACALPGLRRPRTQGGGGHRCPSGRGRASSSCEAWRPRPYYSCGACRLMDTLLRRPHELLGRLRAATETLELIAADRGTLAVLSEDEHRRLRAAAALVCNPDVRARRTMAKALGRRRRQEQSDRDEGLRAATGIRVLRRPQVFTTPNVFPPEGFAPSDRRPRRRSSTRHRRPLYLDGRAQTAAPQVLLHLQAAGTRRFITFTTACVRPAASSTSRSEPSWRTCAAGSRS